MIYLDSSVALAHLFLEERRPGEELWAERLVASRLLEYEIFNRINARELASETREAARTLLTRVDLIDLGPDILARALHPFPVHVRTLDALHLATMLFLTKEAAGFALATYDRRLEAAAKACGVACRTA